MFPVGGNRIPYPSTKRRPGPFVVGDAGYSDDYDGEYFKWYLNHNAGNFLLLVVCTSLLAECIECVPRWSSVLAIVAVIAVLIPLFIPTYQGYASNAEIAKANEAALWKKTDALITLNLDINGTYGYVLVYTSASYLGHAMDYYKITTEKITYAGSSWDVAGLYNGSQAGLPAVWNNGELFLPF